jgi:1,2-diacylglycerol 3-alpha-glucosyltransferase
VRIRFPWPLSQLAHGPRLDLVHGQANSHIVHYAIWLRKMYGTAVLNTHIIHLPTHSHFLLSDGLWANPLVWQFMQQWAASMERQFAALYNQGDGLIVQSRYMIDYWRKRGVTVPIEAVGRPIDPAVFSRSVQSDPFPAHFEPGKRLLVVCRHDREKNLEVLLRIFQEEIAPAEPEATLTLVGDGFDHPNLLARAQQGAHADRVHFAGEARHGSLVDWYSHADVFIYTSLSETFGNVINEALWSGLPVVALDDRMGVAHQVIPSLNGYLIEPDRSDTRERFAAAVLGLLWNRRQLRQLGENAATCARRTSHPDVILSRYERLYEAAIRRLRSAGEVPLVQRSRAVQARAFARHIGLWAYWSSVLIGVARTATRVGVARLGTDTHYPTPAAVPMPLSDEAAPTEIRYQDAAE